MSDGPGEGARKTGTGWSNRASSLAFSKERYGKSERATLEDVQRATEAGLDRYRHYESAEKVMQMFRDDLNSEPAQRIHRELHCLNLPSLDELSDEFFALVERLGIGSRGR